MKIGTDPFHVKNQSGEAARTVFAPPRRFLCQSAPTPDSRLPTPDSRLPTHRRNQPR
ncbi:hypothetical protein EKD04_010470 [Chloroflexales bacterium ZM16-3]|nr:hypothetical protein [Chloroflexales bacterium ZM16-3]